MSSGTDGFPRWETPLLIVGGVCLAAAAVVWVVGGLAGVLASGDWAAGEFADTPHVLARLAEHLDDPRNAWPADARASLPGPAGFVGAGVLIGLCLGGTVAAALTIKNTSRRTRASETSARWATRRDLRPLQTPPRPNRRIVLGRRSGRLLAAEPRQSVLIVAPTQSGKTTGIAIPAILDWDGPVIATSVKTDLVRDTHAHRAAVGDVRIFDPAAATGLFRASWTPLASCTTWEDARKTADRLARATHASQRSLQDAEFWSQAASRYLAPLLLAAARSGRDIGDVTRWIVTEDQAEVLAALEGLEEPAARLALRSSWESDERLKASLAITANLALEAYTDPTVLECGRASEITAGWLLAGRNTTYLCAPVDEQARLRPLFSTLIRELVAEVYARASARGGPIDPPLLLVLDEAANIAPLPDLDQLAATGAGQGLQLVTVVQDLAQVHDRWGRRADTVVNNHRAKLFGAGTTCLRTLEHVSRVLGDAAVRQQSRTDGETGRRSTTESLTFRPLAPANVLRERRVGSMLLVYGSLPPALIQTRPWTRDRRFRALHRQ